MQPTPYLFFNGTCKEAIDTYVDVLGAEVVSNMPASEMPPDFPVPEDRKSWIMHCDLKIGDGRIMASDNIFDTSEKMAGASVMLSYPTRAEAHDVFTRLAEGGAVTMAFEPTFWSAGFGTCTDKFGIRWMIGTDETP